MERSGDFGCVPRARWVCDQKTVGATACWRSLRRRRQTRLAAARSCFLGLADGVQRISVDLPYSIRDHADIDGDNPGTPTPDVVQQILENSNNAVRVAQAAKDAAENAHRAAEDAAIKAGEEAGGAAASAAAAAASAETANAAKDAAAKHEYAAAASEANAEAAATAAGESQDAAAQSAQRAATSAAAAAKDAGSIARLPPRPRRRPLPLPGLPTGGKGKRCSGCCIRHEGGAVCRYGHGKGKRSGKCAGPLPRAPARAHPRVPKKRCGCR